MIATMLVFILIFMLLELPGLRKRAFWQEILLVVILLTVANAYGLAVHLHSSILPNPKESLYVAQPLADRLQSFMGMGED